MSEPAVSVILPVHNGQQYLSDSIDSVLAQTFRNFEFIIWDDQSTDESAHIIASYSDARIKKHRNVCNQGLFPTLNLAISEASAPLIRLWSQDDLMKFNCLAEEVAFLNQHPEVGMSYCAYDLIDKNGVVVRPAQEDPTPEVISPALAAKIMFYHGSITGNIANVMLKKTVMHESTGLFKEEMRIAGDFEMWVRISETFAIGFLRKPMISLRSHAGQLSRQQRSATICMMEDQEIYQVLRQRLPAAEWRYAKKYERRHRYLQYVHFMMRHLVAGDFRTAFDSYKAIRKVDSPWLLFGLWILTADQRFFKLKSKYQISHSGS